MTNHEVVNGTPQVPVDKLGTIYVWIPRIVYVNDSFKYLANTSIVETKEYSLPSCFTYKIKKQPELALTGIWIERTPQNSKTETTAKIEQMNTEENNYGLIKNEVVENISGVANKVVKKVQENKTENAQQVKETNNTNRTMIRIIQTSTKTPIIATAKSSNKVAYIYVTYTKFGIDKIISLDTGEVLSRAENATMPVPENGTYYFAVIDKQKNIKLLTVRVGDGTPEFIGFKVDTTYVVTYEFDDEGNSIEHSTVPIEDILKAGYEVDKNNALVEGTIDANKVAGLEGVWYNYPEQKWANIVVRNNANEAYFTWIPRYVYQLDEVNEVSHVKFVTTENLDSNGNEVDLNEWTLPNAFTWKDEEGEDAPIPGYWIAKYGLTDAVTLDLQANVVGGINKIRVNNITNKSGLTGTTYDLYLYNAGVDRAKVKKGDELQFIENTTSHIFEKLEKGDYEIRIVLNDSEGKYRGENWFTATVIDTAVKAGVPELIGFRVNTTYIVTYTDETDENTMDASIPISEVLANGYTVDENTNALVNGVLDENKVNNILNGTGATWYDYNTQKWANIVVRNNGGEVYYTWIPRYIYKLDNVDETSEIQFIGINDEIPEGWTLPNAFIWADENGNEKQLPGYWIAKYGLTDKTTFNITADVIGGTNKIRISSVQDGSGLGLTYRFYLYEDNAVKEFFAEPEAEMTAEQIANDNDCTGKRYVRYSEGVTEVKYFGLNPGLYDLRIVAYDSRGYYRGEQWFNDIEVVATVDAGGTDVNSIIAPGITASLQTGFNKDVTYYVTYDADGNETLTPITSAPPTDWYDYNAQKWANIVVKGNGKTAYFVWIPRYIYKLDNVREETEIKFVGTDIYGDKIPEGWTLPNAFIWADDGGNPVQTAGYWIAKYGLTE